MESAGRLMLPLLTNENAEPRSAELLEQAQHKTGLTPNMYRAMANSLGVLDTYLYGYERFRQQSGFSPQEQEVVLLTISRENGCEYCMAAHSTIADKASHVPGEVTDAIRDGQNIPDPKLRALSTFVSAMFHTRGRPNEHDLADFLAAGYSERQVLEIVLALAVKTLSNYTNHLFDTEVDKPFQGRVWSERAPEPVAQKR